MIFINKKLVFLYILTSIRFVFVLKYIYLYITEFFCFLYMIFAIYDSLFPKICNVYGIFFLKKSFLFFALTKKIYLLIN